MRALIWHGKIFLLYGIGDSHEIRNLLSGLKLIFLIRHFDMLKCSKVALNGVSFCSDCTCTFSDPPGFCGTLCIFHMYPSLFLVIIRKFSFGSRSIHFSVRASWRTKKKKCIAFSHDIIHALLFIFIAQDVPWYILGFHSILGRRTSNQGSNQAILVKNLRQTCRFLRVCLKMKAALGCQTSNGYMTFLLEIVFIILLYYVVKLSFFSTSFLFGCRLTLWDPLISAYRPLEADLLISSLLICILKQLLQTKRFLLLKIQTHWRREKWWGISWILMIG